MPLPNTMPVDLLAARKRELDAELGPAHGRASCAWACCGPRVLEPTLTPMPRTPDAWISPWHGLRLCTNRGGLC